MLAPVYGVFLWWIATGVVLYLVNLPGRTHPWSFGAATAALAGALAGLGAVADRTDASSALCAFSCAVVIWGWLEMSYLMGLVTGPVTAACPPGCRGFRRFVRALNTSLYHELLVAGAGVGLWLASAGDANRIGAWTFAALWLMRWSAKLNLFLGVRNLYEDWLPERLRYLTSFMVRRPMNPLFPLSVTGGTLVAGYVGWQAAAAPAGGFDATGLALVATFLALGVVEHWLLVLPVPAAELWSWGLRARDVPGGPLRDPGT